jgi:small-conductance mechanosensitive channel
MKLSMPYATGLLASVLAASLAAGPVLAAPDVRPVEPGSKAGERDDGKDSNGKRGDAERKLVPALDKEGGAEGARRLEDVVKEGEKNLAEIQKLLDEIQGQLSRMDTSDATQTKQREAAEKMTQLLETLEKECQKCSGSSSSSRQPKDSSQSGEKKGEKPEGQKKEKEEPREGEKSKVEKQESDAEKKDGKTENRRAEDQAMPESKAGALRSDLLEASKRWGLLPPKLREEMLLSTDKEFPREYLEIISRYYKRLGEQYEKSRGR